LRHLLIITALVGPLLSSACDSRVDTAEVWAADFDQSCTSDDDCVLVTEGNYCDCLVCTNAAIADSDQAEFQEAATSARNSCSEVETACGSLDEARSRQALSCAYVIAVCEQGTCVPSDGIDDRDTGADTDTNTGDR
jgi:hypothetical protein